MTPPAFTERQPRRSHAFLPALQTEVDAGELRYRTYAHQPWQRVALADIERAEVKQVSRRSWPLGSRCDPPGSASYFTLSGVLVCLYLRGGRRLALGSERPQELLAALGQPSSPTS